MAREPPIPTGASGHFMLATAIHAIHLLSVTVRIFCLRCDKFWSAASPRRRSGLATIGFQRLPTTWPLCAAASETRRSRFDSRTRWIQFETGGFNE
jgi:hypothetical protein